MDIYADEILDHFRHPRHKNALQNKTVTHEEVNLSCGDTLTLSLFIENGVVTDIGWDGTGCAISQASMSMLSEELVGKTVEQAEKISKQDVYNLLAVPIGTRRMKCALLSLHALKNALRKAKGLQEQGWIETVEVEDE